MSTNPLTDTGSLKQYVPNTLPQLDGGDKRYLSTELQKISACIASLITAAQELEARIHAGGL